MKSVVGRGRDEVSRSICSCINCGHGMLDVQWRATQDFIIHSDAWEVGSLVSMATWLLIGMYYGTHAAFSVAWQDPTIDI